MLIPTFRPGICWPPKARLWVSVRPSRYPALRQSGKHCRQRADPVRAPSLRWDIDRCWPSTKPAFGFARLAQPEAPSASREIRADRPARPAGPVTSPPHGALPGLRPLQLVRALLGCAGSRVDHPVVGLPYRLDRTLTAVVGCGKRSAKPVSGVAAVGQALSTASRPGPSALPALGHRPVLAVDKASVRVRPAGPARGTVGVQRNPCRPTSSACGTSDFSAARRASWAPPTSARPRSSRLRGFTRRPPSCRSAIPARPNAYVWTCGALRHSTLSAACATGPSHAASSDTSESACAPQRQG